VVQEVAVARYKEPTSEQAVAWDEWVASRPEAVRKVAKRFDPWTLYKMKSTGQRVTLVAIGEDGTVRVNITGEFNLLGFERSVFGVDPRDLVECELPSDEEPLGTLDLTPDEVTEHMKLDPVQRQSQMMQLMFTHPLRTYPRDWKKGP
jgi:hypothetical protein